MAVPTLPNELLLMIFRQCGKYSLKQIRLVSQQWALLACSFLFDRIFISSRSEDMEVFDGLAHHSVIRHSIKELVYDVARFKQISYAEYGESLIGSTNYNVNCLRRRRPLLCQDPELDAFVELVNTYVAPKRELRNSGVKRAMRLLYDCLWEKCSKFAFIREGHKLWMQRALEPKPDQAWFLNIVHD